MPASTKTLSYERTRWLLLLVGLVILGLIAAIMFARRVDPVEVAATILFLPVFMAFLLFGIRGGIVGGLLAALGYVALRYPDIQAVGADRFAGLIATRSIGYLVFGVVGGWATDTLSASIVKLDLYDHIDDATGLHNSRYLIETIDLERSRSTRYEKVFSVVTIERPLQTNGKQRKRYINAVAADIRLGARTVDQVVHATQDDVDIFAIVLPETGAEGSRVFAGKLTTHLDEVASSFEEGTGTWLPSTVTFPGQETELDALVARFKEIVKVDYPESSVE